MSVPAHTGRPLSSAASMIAATVRDWFSIGRGAHVVAELGPDERQRVLRDNGLGTSDLQGWTDAPFATEDLAGEMMMTIGLDADRLHLEEPMVMRDVERVCLSCRSRRKCLRSLRKGDAAATFGSFCPNAVTFEALREAV